MTPDQEHGGASQPAPPTRLERLAWLAIGVVLLNSLAVVYGFRELGQLAQSVRWLMAPPLATAATSLPPSKAPTNRPKVVVDLYSDFGCTFCRESSPAIDSIRREFGDKVFWRYRYLASPIRSDPLSFDAALAGVCTAKDGGPWQLYAAIRPDLPWTRATLDRAIAQLQAGVPDLQKCMASNEAADKVWSDVFEAAARGVRSTPTLYVNGKLISAQITAPPLRLLIQDALDRAAKADTSARPTALGSR